MNANKIMTAQELIDTINEQQKVKILRKEKGLLERPENEDKIILTEDNRQILLG